MNRGAWWAIVYVVTKSQTWLLVVVQSPSCVWLFASHGLQHTRLPCPSPSPRVCPNSCPLNGDAIQLSHHCCPLLLPSIFPTSGSFPLSQLFASGGQKYWSFNFSISPSKEYSGLISFKIDWFDLLAFQGTFKSLLQDHSLKASILQHSAFFSVQLSHLYMTTGKTRALII